MPGWKLTVFILHSWHVSSVMGARSGPFKSSYTRVEPCASPTTPIDKDPASAFYGELYNTSTEFNVLKGKVTVFREHQIKKMKAKSYLWNSNKWKVNYMINNMGCNRVYFPVLALATGVKYDLKSCTFYKGVYAFNDMNVDKMQHIWMKTQEYGRVLWRIEVFSYTGSVFCYEFETLIEPAK